MSLAPGSDTFALLCSGGWCQHLRDRGWGMDHECVLGWVGDEQQVGARADLAACSDGGGQHDIRCGCHAEHALWPAVEHHGWADHGDH